MAASVRKVNLPVRGVERGSLMPSLPPGDMLHDATGRGTPRVPGYAARLRMNMCMARSPGTWSVTW